MKPLKNASPLFTWTMSEAKRDFSIGYLTDFSIVAAPFGGWNVLLSGGSRRAVLVDAREGESRIFKTVDAAVSALGQIGFRVESLTRG